MGRGGGGWGEVRKTRAGRDLPEPPPPSGTTGKGRGRRNASEASLSLSQRSGTRNRFRAFPSSGPRKVAGGTDTHGRGAQNWAEFPGSNP
jgi:hypothetical protein